MAGVEGAPPAQDLPVSTRAQIAVYGIGMFNTSVFAIGSVVIPLQVAAMNPSPLMFGLVFAAGHILPLLFSIHAGGLMDRLGARRVMLVCTLATAILPLFYPATSWIWALIALQMFLGFSETLGWLGAQTMIGQYMHGKTVYAGRLSFWIRFPQFIAPPMAGAAWDFFGAWAAYGVMAGWAACGFFCALLLPKLPVERGGEVTTSGRGRIGRLMPRASDYITAFGLLSSPAIVVIVVLGALMHTGNAVQGSFYVAWLNNMGIAGTAIGLLSPAAAIGAAIFSLITAPLHRHVSGFWIVLVSLWIGVVLICITPLLGTYLLLQAAMFLRSGMNGLAQPLVITLVLRGAGRNNQGKAVGLRGTANRVASIIAPLAMGAIAEVFGLEMAFYIVGVAVSAAMAWVGWYLWRNPKVAGSGEE